MNKSSMAPEIKNVAFTIDCVEEIKEGSVNGVPIGRINGLAATFQRDRGDDVILPGAFAKSLHRHRESDRPVRMLFQHRSEFLIGQFPIHQIRETAEGLEVKGEINLEVQKGREAFALARQGVLSDFSIGFSIIEEEFRDGIRFIKELELWEISPVGEPMNIGAKITEVKSAVPFGNLPFADEATAWDASAAKKRVQDFTNSGADDVSSSYRRAFFWFDSANSDVLGAYKLPFADVIDGSLKAVPRGIFAAAGAMSGARGGVDIPSGDRAAVTSNINRYYDKMGLDSPLKKSLSTGDALITLEDVDDLCSIRDFEGVLKKSGNFSRKAIDRMAHFAKSYQGDPENGSNEGDPQSENTFGADYYRQASKELTVT